LAIENHFEKGWLEKLRPFLATKEFKYIGAHLLNLVSRGYPVTPKFDDMFRAFKECPYDKLKVVMIGQD
jgi:uracil DNA glycosylase